MISLILILKDEKSRENVMHDIYLATLVNINILKAKSHATALSFANSIGEKKIHRKENLF